MRVFILTFCIFFISFCASATQLSTTEQFILTQSLAPGLHNQTATLYVREINASDKHTDANRAVLFIHGGGTPSEVAFDVPYKDYSWMTYLASRGFAVYALDLTGYGRSTRPIEMSNPCNLSASDQQQFIPALIEKECTKTHSQALTTNESDWADMDAAINFILEKNKLKSLALIGWSQGGPRSLNYTLLHPEKINSLVLFAPAYGRNWPLTQTAKTPLTQLMGAQNKSEFMSGWNKQVGCADQIDKPIQAVLWQDMMRSDAVGSAWGTGVRLAPEQDWHWGFNRALAAKIVTPTLLVSGEFDQQVPPKTVRELYADLGSPKKVFVDLGCSSHRANWETNHLLLFNVSADWIANNAIKKQSIGEVKLGYKPANKPNPTRK